ncbi:hypothetical protein SAMN04487936_106232 [Halobacillus dabanensis]|uniref:Uncharacterized protein n=1 Tax=Halobacillus dabanensis TaxID=240302 RepID=A0A1I3W809_HALDA|nr:hypothetical protein [Halobacillus dabanensis]SFK03409.1 hypothetical protein SAMN04487936_106232 [Halobacillus dabanensis]
MNKKILMIALVVIVVSWGANLWYYQSKQLDEALFLKHYYAEVDTFEIYYLMNKQDPKKVQSIEFSDGTVMYPDYKNTGFPQDNPRMTFNVLSESTHYWMASAQFDTKEVTRESIDHQGEAIITMDDGEMIVADIGTIITEEPPERSGVFKQDMSSGGSDGRSTQSYTVKERIKIEDISSPFPELTDEMLIKIHHTASNGNRTTKGHLPDWYEKERDLEWEKVAGVNLPAIDYPLIVEQGDHIRQTIQHNKDALNAYWFPLKVTGTMENGKDFVERFLVYNHPSFTSDQMDELVERVGDE